MKPGWPPWFLITDLFFTQNTKTPLWVTLRPKATKTNQGQECSGLDDLLWCRQKNTEVIVGCIMLVFLVGGDVFMLLYKWLRQSDLRHSTQVHTQKRKFEVGEEQRRVIKKKREMENSSHKNRIKKCGRLRLENGVMIALYKSVKWLITR